MSLMKQILRMKQNDLGPFRAGLADAQLLIPRAGRFQVDQAVMAAVGRMEQTPFKDFLILLDRAHLPFPIMWIEWLNPDGQGRIGYLCEQLLTGGFAFRQFLSERTIQKNTGFSVICTIGRVLVEPAGWSAEDKADDAGARAETGKSHLELAACDMLCLLLMINSPSQILEIGEGDDNAVVDAKRAQKGRPPLANWRPIRFNITRFQQAGFVDGVLPTNQRQVAEHFVRGHFKIRKNGMFWWSPHVRYQVMDDNPVALPRDYQVTAGRRADEQDDGQA